MSKLSEVAFDDLNLLLKATSKQQVIELCQYAYENREDVSGSNVARRAVQLLDVDSGDASKLAKALCGLVNSAIFRASNSSEEVKSLFPANFHKNLADLLSQIITEKLPSWKSGVMCNSVGLPRLAEFDWRVDLKMASGKVSRMNEPTCILHLKVLDPSCPPGQDGRFKTLNVELTKEKLDTMLNGLGRIRDQLSAVAKK